MIRLPAILLFLGLGLQVAMGADRFAYLDDSDPFYVHRDFPKLTTPQWVGESGVDAVVILAIDDLRAPDRYEDFLRPLLDRLKRIDGRAPVSIFCNAVDPADARFVSWGQEGLSFEVHTLSHPCPLLAKGDWAAAWDTYHGCVELLNRIPGNRPVAFRMPCCDSMNSPSPRFYAELLATTNQAGQFLKIDSSVMNLITTNDTTVPREWIVDGTGASRFSKYLPAHPNASTKVSLGSFVTTIEDYPYPYVIGGVVWEFPAMVPSDWEAQNWHGTNNPVTVADWKAALDIVVRKQGTFTFIFHPHGWISSQQMVEFVDYAVERYGPKVKFLTLREASERLDQHLLQGHALRAADGSDHGVRLLDLNDDGFLDIVAGSEADRWTRLWNAQENRWTQTDFPAALIGSRAQAGARCGVVGGKPVLLMRTEHETGAWKFEHDRWQAFPQLLTGLEVEGQPLLTASNGKDTGVRLRDLDGDGQSEVLVLSQQRRAVWTWQNETWKPLPCVLPRDLQLVDQEGRDAGLRFVDLNSDGHDDLLFSNTNRFSVDLFVAAPRENLGFSYGWSFRVREGSPTNAGAIPMIVRGGEHPNNGAWFRRQHMWVQNEDTAHLPDKVDRRSFADLTRFEVFPARSPEESLRSMEVRPGFVMELVAAEPLVQDPVAFEWGADGRLWVAEMTDYPSGFDGKGEPGGRIRVLEDTNHDGRFDRSEIFLDKIGFPSGVMPWRRGVLVSAAPQIFYAEDGDGDGRAEVRIPLLEGFGQGNQQHRVNGFELGLDNWIYVANGDSGGRIRVVGRVGGPYSGDGEAFDLRGHDLRFLPDEGRAEPIVGQTQFGRRRDDWGNWFGNNNPHWGWHYWIEERYLKRNPELPLRSARQELPDYETRQQVYARSEPVVRLNWPGGFNLVTSANSLTPYRDDLPEMTGSIFVSEPANNVIHREILEEHGVSFRSHRPQGEEKSEFIAARDGWFRPTMLKTGPDGALYVADMYRLVIEHPEYALPGIERLIDLRAGEGMGRIYRIYPRGASLRPFRALDRLSTAELVEALDSGNGWTRDTVHRLLLHRADRAAPLRKLLREGKEARGRLQALAVLSGLATLEPADVLVALKDAHPSVRALALRVSEEWLRGNLHPEILEALLSMVNDESVRVRFQLALSLGESRDPRVGSALLSLGILGGEDSQMKAGVLSSSYAHAGAMLESALAKGSAQTWLEPLTALALAVGQEDSIRQALLKVTNGKDGFASWQFAGFAGFLEVGQRRGANWNEWIRRWHVDPVRIVQIFQAARLLASDGTASVDDRGEAIRLLAQGPDPLTVGGETFHNVQALGGLLGTWQRPEIELAAINGLSKHVESSVVDVLAHAWSTLGPERRTTVMNVLLSRDSWVKELLSRIESGEIPANQIGVSARQRLLQNDQSETRKQAARLLGATSPQRAQLLERYAAVASLVPEVDQGAKLFAQHCASCHRLKEQGVALGPDLAALSDKSIPTLLVAILDPNRAVEPVYVNYSAHLADGREVEGLVVGETANSITLRSAGGVETVVLRGELKELRSLGLSLMPEGLEQALDPQQMANLLGYVRD